MQTVDRHAQAGAQACVLMFILTVVGSVLTLQVLHQAWPTAWMDGATLAWPLNSSPLNGGRVGPPTAARFVVVGGIALIAIGAIAAAVYGAITLRLVPVIFAGAAFGIVLGLADFAIERDWGVAIWTDRIEVRGGDALRVYRPDDVVRVEMACEPNYRRRSRSKQPTVDYRLVFADDAYVDFVGSRPGKIAEQSAWLHTLGSLDRVWAAGAPRVVAPNAAALPDDQARCLRRLTELPPKDVAVARRLLGLDGAAVSQQDGW